MFLLFFFIYVLLNLQISEHAHASQTWRNCACESVIAYEPYMYKQTRTIMRKVKKIRKWKYNEKQQARCFVTCEYFLFLMEQNKIIICKKNTIMMMELWQWNLCGSDIWKEEKEEEIMCMYI